MDCCGPLRLNESLNQQIALFCLKVAVGVADSCTEAKASGSQMMKEIFEEYGEAPSFEELGPPIHTLPPDLPDIEPVQTQSPTEALQTEPQTVGESTTSSADGDGNHGNATVGESTTSSGEGDGNHDNATVGESPISTESGNGHNGSADLQSWRAS